MPNGDQVVPVTGPDGKLYHFPFGTTKDKAVAYFKKKGIGATTTAPTQAAPTTDQKPHKYAEALPGGYLRTNTGHIIRPQDDPLHAFMGSFMHSFGISQEDVEKAPTTMGAEKVAFKEAGKALTSSIGQEWKKAPPELKAIFPFHLAARFVENIADQIPQQAKDIESGDLRVIAAGAGSVLGSKAQMKAFDVVDSFVKNPPKTALAVKDMFPKAQLVAATNKVLENSAKQTLGHFQQFSRATNDSIGRMTRDIAGRDVNASPQGSFGKRGIFNAVMQEVQATSGTRTRTSLPKTLEFMKDLRRYGNNLTWEDVKDLRNSIEEAKHGASGQDLAVLGRSQQILTEGMKNRAIALGAGDVFDRYTTATKSLAEAKGGILYRLSGAKSGLDFFNTLADEANRPALDKAMSLFEEHAQAPKGYIDTLLNDHDALHRFARLSQGSSLFGLRGGRLSAIMRHPAVSGGAAAASSYLMTQAGVPMGLRFLLSLGSAMAAGDLADRYSASRQLQNLKGSPTLFPGMTPQRGAAGGGLGPTPQTPGQGPGPGGLGAGPTPQLPNAPAQLPQGGMAQLATLPTPSPSSQEIEDIRRSTGLPLTEEAATRRIHERTDLPQKLSNSSTEVKTPKIAKEEWDRPVEPTTSRTLKDGTIVWTEPSTTSKIIFAAERALTERGFPKENIGKLRQLAMDKVGVGHQFSQHYAEVLKDAIREHDIKAGPKITKLSPEAGSRATKQRERVAKVRAEKGSSAYGGGGLEKSGGGAADIARQAIEAKQASKTVGKGHILEDVKTMGIPELEEEFEGLDKEAFDGLKREKKLGKIPEAEYQDYLRYYVDALREGKE